MKESFLKVASASNGLAFMELTAPFSPCVGLWTEKFDGPACEEERMVGLHVCRDTDGDTQGRQASRSRPEGLHQLPGGQEGRGRLPCPETQVLGSCVDVSMC